jgi:histone arginine demethylase JMJD6
VDDVQIDRLEGISARDFYHDHVLARKPAVIRNATQWPAFGKWSLDFFRDRFADANVRIDKKSWRMADFIERVKTSSASDPAPYLREWPINRELPELIADISPAPAVAQPNWLGGNLLPKRWKIYGGVPELLIGGAGAGFPYLHYDEYHLHAFITQIVGGKDFVMFDPADTPYLYPLGDGSLKTHLRDVRNVDLEKFPLFAKATPITFRAEAGDTIFIPSGWWHVTYLDEPTIAVSLNAANGSNWMAMSRDMSRDSAGIKRALKFGYLAGLSMLVPCLPRGVAQRMHIA